MWQTCRAKTGILAVELNNPRDLKGGDRDNEVQFAFSTEEKRRADARKRKERGGGKRRRRRKREWMV